VWYVLTAGRDPVSFGVCFGAYLFSGIWLSDDLDTNSLAYKRWGVVRFLWWPYRILVPHRSWLSHGIAVGPLVRAIYFVLAAWAVLRGLLALIDLFVAPVDQRSVLGAIGHSLTLFLTGNKHLAMVAVAGLILGGVTHSVLDTLITRAKKLW